MSSFVGSQPHTFSLVLQIESMGRTFGLVSGRSLVVSSVTSIFGFFSCITVLPGQGSLTTLHTASKKMGNRLAQRLGHANFKGEFESSLPLLSKQ
jgi:Na+/H+-dicarboxylate symporter